MRFEEGMALMRQLHARVSGVCIPNYVVDIPGGIIKVPVTPDHVTPDPAVKGQYWIKDYEGNLYKYNDIV
jgi:lysine 2,3-aminomutase